MSCSLRHPASASSPLWSTSATARCTSWSPHARPREAGRREWQESVKHGRRLSFTTFTSKVLAGDADTAHAKRFRASQDLLGVLQRWSGTLPQERLHIVTCPPQGAMHGLLWERFADAVQIDSHRFAHRDEGLNRSLNRSLGRHEIDLLRRVNRALDGGIVQPTYSQVVKELFAQQVLSIDPSPRPTLPADLYPEMTHAGERWIKEIDAARYAVHGDLDDLLPLRPSGEAPHPDEVDPRAELSVAARACADLLVELTRLRTENERLQRKRRGLRRKLAVLES